MAASFFPISQYIRPASTMASVDPRAAPFRNESRAFSEFAPAPPRPCLNRFPQWSSSIASLSGRSASFHDRHTSDAARRFDCVNEAAILASTSYGRPAKSREGAGFGDPAGASFQREAGLLSLDEEGGGGGGGFGTRRLEAEVEAERSVWWWWWWRRRANLAARSSTLEPSKGRAVKRGLSVRCGHVRCFIAAVYG